MNAQCLILKQEFEENCQRYQWQERDQTRLNSLSDLLLVIHNTVLVQDHLKKIIESYEDILKILKGETSAAYLQEYLDRAETRAVDILLKPLKLLTDEQIRYLNLAKSQTYSLGYVLAATIHYMLLEKATQNQATTYNFNLFWDLHISGIIDAFGFKNNSFTKGFAKQMLCDSTIDPMPIVNHDNILGFIFHLCSTLQDYLFIDSLSKIYNDSPLSGGRVHLSREIITILCNRVNPTYAGRGDCVQIGQSFRLTGMGIESISSRNDSLVIIGKHKSADIRFAIEDSTVEDICTVICRAQDQAFIADCSKKTRTMLKLIPEVKYEVAEGMIFNISQIADIYIKKIEFFYDEEDTETLQSKLTFLYLTGPYTDVEKFLSTRIRNSNDQKTVFLLGKGGNPSPDIFCFIDAYVSTKHLEFTYDPANPKWYIADKGSKNGTFKLFKNITEYRNNERSRFIPLFIDNSDLSSVVMISNYAFLFNRS